MTYCHPLRARNQRPRIAAGARGFSLLEILIVIVIVALLMGILVVGGAEWSKQAKVTQTQMILAAVDAVVDEYYTVTERYFDKSVGGDNAIGEFLGEVESVGDIPKMIGALRNDTWESTNWSDHTILDAWGRPIRIDNPNTGFDTSKRPVFWSYGPDEDDPADDIYSSGGEP